MKKETNQEIAKRRNQICTLDMYIQYTNLFVLYIFIFYI